MFVFVSTLFLNEGPYTFTDDIAIDIVIQFQHFTVYFYSYTVTKKEIIK